MGQEIYKNKRTFNIRKQRPKIERPHKKEMSLDDSLEVEYQKWLKREPLRMKTPAGGYHEYVMPKLPKFNPENMRPPQITYHYDIHKLDALKIPNPSSGLTLTFDLGQLISSKARDHARDMKHLERAKKILKHY